MARHSDWRRIRKNRNYTYDEAAVRLGVHPRTVMGWVRTGGLRAFIDSRPHLIRGDDLVTFLKARRTAKRIRLRLHEFYCLRCKAPRPAAGRMADCPLTNLPTANLRALCPNCGTLMHKRVSLARLDELSAHLEIMRTQAPSTLRGEGFPC